MKSKNFDGMDCSVAEVMAAIGDRWGLLIMRDVLLGLTRYDDLQRSTGVTNTTLSSRLKELEQSGLLQRKIYQTRPDRYEYIPTSKGQDLRLLMQAMVQIGDGWRQESGKNPPLQFVNTQNNRTVKLSLIEVETGQIVPEADKKVILGPGADDIMQWRLNAGEQRFI